MRFGIMYHGFGSSIVLMYASSDFFENNNYFLSKIILFNFPFLIVIPITRYKKWKKPICLTVLPSMWCMCKKNQK